MSTVSNITESAFHTGALPLDSNEREAGSLPEIVISIRGLRKSYGHIEAVRGIDLDIAQGEIFGLIGPDGAGKTSVFQILGGVMEATKGETLAFGRTSREVRSSIANLLKGEMERWHVSLFGDRLHVIVAGDAMTGINKLKQRLGSEGIQVIEAYEDRFSLEDVFIAVVEQARKEGRVATED